MIAPGINIVRPGLADQWADPRLSPRLRETLLWAGAWCQERGGTLWITSLWRSWDEEYDIQIGILSRQGMAETERHQCAIRLADSSLHPRWRACDTRIPVTAGASVSDLLVEAAERWPYDPQRPRLRPVIRHLGTGDHLHWKARMAGPAA